ncbi:uncharacterized protein METZ01_LOCUS7552 [marine metagenome]|mgnify:CR=1 FL=1|uniref:Uncharacterized protein n=1 Tax=marine metagenome TaxID=408172 RepID=A0A381NLJ9_9ZZZZ
MSSVNKKLCNSIKRERTTLQKELLKMDAWAKGKQVFLTIKNPDERETKKPFIRVPAEQVWKKYEPYRMKQSVD